MKDTGYFYSIQPFWEAAEEDCTGCMPWEKEGISVSHMKWQTKSWLCVPGNGQIGLILSDSEEFFGICYGVLSKKAEISLHGLKTGLFVRFAPGRFSDIFSIPAYEILPDGMDMRDILSPVQVGQLKDAVCLTGAERSPQEAVFSLLSSWNEEKTGLKKQTSRTALQIQHLIWEKRGNIKMKELELETAYTGRRIQELMVEKVGIPPKQLCRQTRFQHALREIHRECQFQRENEGTTCLAQEAVRLGYCDQAHYSREFKEFSGFCPGAYRKKSSHLYKTIE